MSLPPLTNHEIVALIEPYTRRGRRVDLAASDRLARRLVFKAVDHDVGKHLVDMLVLEQPDTGRYRLTRTLLHPDGLDAVLVAEGPHAGELLDRIEHIAPHEQFIQLDDFPLFQNARWSSRSSTS